MEEGEEEEEGEVKIAIAPSAPLNALQLQQQPASSAPSSSPGGSRDLKSLDTRDPPSTGHNDRATRWGVLVAPQSLEALDVSNGNPPASVQPSHRSEDDMDWDVPSATAAAASVVPVMQGTKGLAFLRWGGTGMLPAPSGGSVGGGTGAVVAGAAIGTETRAPEALPLSLAPPCAIAAEQRGSLGKDSASTSGQSKPAVASVHHSPTPAGTSVTGTGNLAGQQKKNSTRWGDPVRVAGLAAQATVGPDSTAASVPASCCCTSSLQPPPPRTSVSNEFRRDSTSSAPPFAAATASASGCSELEQSVNSAVATPRPALDVGPLRLDEPSAATPAASAAATTGCSTDACSVAAVVAAPVPQTPAATATARIVSAASQPSPPSDADLTILLASVAADALAATPTHVFASMTPSFRTALAVVCESLRRARVAVSEADAELSDAGASIAAIAAERRAQTEATAGLRAELEAAALATARTAAEAAAAADAEAFVRTKLKTATLPELRGGSGGSGGLAAELLKRQADAMTLRWRVSELEAEEAALRSRIDSLIVPAATERFKQQTDALLRRKLSAMQARSTAAERAAAAQAELATMLSALCKKPDAAAVSSQGAVVADAARAGASGPAALGTFPPAAAPVAPPLEKSAVPAVAGSNADEEGEIPLSEELKTLRERARASAKLKASSQTLAPGAGAAMTAAAGEFEPQQARVIPQDSRQQARSTLLSALAAAAAAGAASPIDAPTLLIPVPVEGSSVSTAPLHEILASTLSRHGAPVVPAASEAQDAAASPRSRDPSCAAMPVPSVAGAAGPLVPVVQAADSTSTASPVASESAAGSSSVAVALLRSAAAANGARSSNGFRAAAVAAEPAPSPLVSTAAATSGPSSHLHAQPVSTSLATTAAARSRLTSTLNALQLVRRLAPETSARGAGTSWSRPAGSVPTSTSSSVTCSASAIRNPVTEMARAALVASWQTPASALSASSLASTASGERSALVVFTLPRDLEPPDPPLPPAPLHFVRATPSSSLRDAPKAAVAGVALLPADPSTIAAATVTELRDPAVSVATLLWGSSNRAVATVDSGDTAAFTAWQEELACARTVAATVCASERLSAPLLAAQQRQRAEILASASSIEAAAESLRRVDEMLLRTGAAIAASEMRMRKGAASAAALGNIAGVLGSKPPTRPRARGEVLGQGAPMPLHHAVAAPGRHSAPAPPAASEQRPAVRKAVDGDAPSAYLSSLPASGEPASTGKRKRDLDPPAAGLRDNFSAELVG